MATATFADGDTWPQVCAVTGGTADRMYSLLATTPLPDRQELSLAAASPGHLLSTSGGTPGWVPLTGAAARGQLVRRRGRAAALAASVLAPIVALIAWLATDLALVTALVIALVAIAAFVGLFVVLGRRLVAARDHGHRVTLQGLHPSFVAALGDHGLTVDNAA